MEIRLKRNLRKSIKRGHPWVYAQAIQEPKSNSKASLCKLVDNKGFLAWGIYDPYSPLAVRILTTHKSLEEFEVKFSRAQHLRNVNILGDTNCYRLFNGEGDCLPGLVCDVYDKVAVLQFDGRGMKEFWDQKRIADWIIENTDCSCVVLKSRNSEAKAIEFLAGEKLDLNIWVKENSIQFKVDIENGQKTGFFLDQRDNRQYVKQISEGKDVLNLFSYTGGFSVYAGLGGARQVTSVDLAKPAVDFAQQSWEQNKLDPKSHLPVAEDVFKFLKSSNKNYDLIIVDPPSMAKNEKQKDSAVSKYIDVYSAAAQKLRPGGGLCLSSCSSHISFKDFFNIIEESLSQSRRTGQLLRIAGQGADHPFLHMCHEMRYLKFVHLILD